MNMHLTVLMVIIVTMGSFGGVIKFLINQKKKYKTKSSFWLDLFKAVIVGIGAAILVPLFLNMVSSDLLEQTGKDNYSYFVFAGFCLIAAITSHKFIISISEQILKAASEVINKVEKLESNLEPIIAKETEPEVVQKLNFEPEEDFLFEEDDSEEVKILKAISYSKYTYRTVNGLIKSTKLAKVIVDDKLAVLIAGGYVEQIISKKGLRLYITEKGRKRLLSW